MCQHLKKMLYRCVEGMELCKHNSEQSVCDVHEISKGEVGGFIY